jgi:NADPH-dependent 2,4-dienoyl-CoA reductase/sulfur reductase-like enzyme
MPQRYVIIGGGLAGRETAKQLRRKNAEAAITLICEEPHLPYDRPPLSKEYLQGTKSREEIFLEKPDFYEQQNIDVRLGAPADGIDLVAHEVHVGGDVIPFDKAILATGGTPTKLPIPGADRTGVFYLRSIDDAEAIGTAAKAGARAVVIGGGFIGMEVAATLTTLGVETTVVEEQGHIWSRFLDERLAGFFQDYCSAKGVAFRCATRVSSIDGADAVTGVTTRSANTDTEPSLDDGQSIPCEFVCIGIGIRPNVALAEAAGLEVDNGIVVDEFLRTSHPDVYAAGDVVNYPDPYAGRRRVEHWSHAGYCGRLIAGNLTGDPKPYDFLAFVWSDVFDLALKFAGDAGTFDRILVRGEMSSDGFSVLYMNGSRLTGCFSINGDVREFAMIKQLIQKRTDLTGKDDQLQNRDCDVKTLR